MVKGRAAHFSRQEPGAAGTDRRPASWARLLLPALALALAAIVQRRAIGAFFSVDDLVRLEEAAGLLPQPRTLWRLVSEVLYVKGMLALFGPRPLPFHVVSMALHLVNTGFVYRTGRKAGLPAAAALFAAAFFGTFHLFYAVLPSAVNINDVMALTFVFVALLALETPGAARAAAGVGCFAVALLSKEAVVFVPFAAALLSRSGERIAGVRRLSPLLVVGAAFAGIYLAFRKHGLGTGGEAYAVGFGVNLFHNLMTYGVWSVDLVRLAGGGSFDPGAWHVGVWPVAAFALAASLSRRRRALILFGCAWWLLGLVPVLPLLAHSYGHYLYVPMAGLALAAAGSLDALTEGNARRATQVRIDVATDSAPVSAPAGDGQRGRDTRQRVFTAAAFIVLTLVVAARSESLVRTRVTARLGASQFALDPFIRKMEVAQRSVASVAGKLDRWHDSLVVFMPPGFGQGISPSTGRLAGPTAPGIPYDVTKAVLGGGRALKLFEPRIDSVTFVSWWSPAYRNFTLFIEGEGGQLLNMGRGPVAHAGFASGLLDGGYHGPARDYLASLVKAFPRDRMIRLLFATALAQTGDPGGATAQARVVIASAPPDSIATLARNLITRLEAAR